MIESEFVRLTLVNLKEAFFSGLDQYLNRFLELFKAKSGLPELTKLTRTLDNSTHTKITILLLALPHYLRDDALAKTVELSFDVQPRHVRLQSNDLAAPCVVRDGSPPSFFTSSFDVYSTSSSLLYRRPARSSANPAGVHNARPCLSLGLFPSAPASRV
ncbi:hypothetical protein ATANTOWER_017986 [Ataeniobius toweri]|uniref:Uncharacterized protein n=1 Tax=Ataeniobius toweri TaxID=208326 RepID=A0ABU7AZL0_9TELE|nr:hypothetical protein [Ataeniobius toweri]